MRRYRLVLGSGLLSVLMASIASAGPLRGWYRAYYDQERTQVGARGWDCDLQPISWGIVTERHHTTNICLE